MTQKQEEAKNELNNNAEEIRYCALSYKTGEAIAESTQCKRKER